MPVKRETCISLIVVKRSKLGDGFDLQSDETPRDSRAIVAPSGN